MGVIVVYTQDEEAKPKVFGPFLDNRQAFRWVKLRKAGWYAGKTQAWGGHFSVTTVADWWGVDDFDARQLEPHVRFTDPVIEEDPRTVLLMRLGSF